MVYYLRSVNVGLDKTIAFDDAISIKLEWFKAYASNSDNNIAYNIYYSTDKSKVFSEGPKFVSIDGSVDATITDLTPGQLYFFSVRPMEYNPITLDLTLLPDALNNLKYYPSSYLASDITDTDIIIPVLDVATFPDSGIIKIGVELIQYFAVNTLNNTLVLSSVADRGIQGTDARYHTTDGYDGVHYWDPEVLFYTGGESKDFDRIFSCQARFERPHYSYTEVDGYLQNNIDLLNSDTSGSDAVNSVSPTYDYAGYHRIDPLLAINGLCTGTYLPEYGCIDGYGNNNKIRGISLQDLNNQRQEQLLTLTGEPVCLLNRQWTGKRCFCWIPSRETPDERCQSCLGDGFVLGYQQFFNPKRSDGRILVRFYPNNELTKLNENGMESEFTTEVWTGSYPTIKARDVLIRFDANMNEEFRYEVISVNRNKMANDGITNLQGAQKMQVQRIRKYDQINRALVFRDTSKLPSTLNTSITVASGIGAHSHVLHRNENDPSTWQQLTQVDHGHNHEVRWNSTTGELEIIENLGHKHSIVIV